jgi:hypothetical protein
VRRTHPLGQPFGIRRSCKRTHRASRPADVSVLRLTFTLSDLVVLVLGTALAFAILPCNFNSKGTAAWGTPAWWNLLACAERAMRITSLALVPLVLWQRVRMGGVCRPAELLLVVCAAPGVVFQGDTSLWHDVDWNLRKGYGIPCWMFRGAAWSLCAAAIVRLVLARRRLSDTARSALLMLAVGTSCALLLCLDPKSVDTSWLRPYDAEAWSHVHTHSVTKIQRAAYIAIDTVRFLVPAVIGAAAIRDMSLRRSRARGLEWVGLLLAACSLALETPVHCLGEHSCTCLPFQVPSLYFVYFGGPVIAGVLSSILVWLCAPLLERWFRPKTVAPTAPRRL